MVIGLQRSYTEDGMEGEEGLAPSSSPLSRTKSKVVPARPPRKGSLPRNGDVINMNGTLEPGDGSYIFIRYF